jgi:hypothetical protein
MENSELNSGDVAAMLDDKIKSAKETNIQTAVEKKPTVIIPKIIKPTIVNTSAPKKTVIGVKNPIPKSKKVRDDVSIYLENFKIAPIGSPNRINALLKIVELITRLPKKSILDEILAFFKENKEAEFLKEQNALQGITTVDMTQHHRIRILYSVMIGLARRTANKRNTSVNMIRNIFNSDDIANWVAIQLNR